MLLENKCHIRFDQPVMPFGDCVKARRQEGANTLNPWMAMSLVTLVVVLFTLDEECYRLTCWLTTLSHDIVSTDAGAIP